MTAILLALAISSAHLIRAPGARAGAAAAPTFESKLKQFAAAAELPALRTEAARLESEMQSAVEEQDFAAAATLRDQLSDLRQKDPAFLASNLRERLEVLVRRESYGEAATTRDQLLVLRRFQPQYQLAGLWKGVYPNHGEATVKIHYEGDTLVAVKMTGDEHVPAGETTFRADLTTPWQEGASVEEIDEEELVGVRVEVVSVGSDGSEQREVERYHGEGRVAARGFQHAHYVPGQLILVEPDTIGFLWQQMGIFVVFNREQDGPGEMMIEQRAVDA
eukprot:CAMPEP_0185310850 /NCGR_PEP_ID=MMETSP1363-20130426/25627_1 /TAXON_ID=38817 /ORGANISM="Gephyrocapsa oceanica, Strain RCC1303" /LENGTH=276 /DNA_ID=CAMNT_0027908441 /DNA_START=34 /DNA_END=864 /DNA_ORIENTATION=+